MGTTADKLQGALNSIDDIQAAINEKGVSVDETVKLSQYGDKIRAIEGGGAPAGEWDDLIQIWEDNKNANSRILLVFSNSFSSNTLSSSYQGNVGNTYRTSDGATYNSTNTHNWDAAQDIPRGKGFIRWVIIDNINPNVLLRYNNIQNIIFIYCGNGSHFVNESINFSTSTTSNVLHIFETIMFDDTVTCGDRPINYNNNSGFQALYGLKKVNFIKNQKVAGNLSYLYVDELIFPEGMESIQTNGASLVWRSVRYIKIPSTMVTIGTLTEVPAIQYIDVVNGYICPSLNMSTAILFPESSAIELFTKLGTAPTARTLTFGSTLLSKWDAATKALATNKGYTLA